MKVSRNTVREVLRSGETKFEYEREAHHAFLCYRRFPHSWQKVCEWLPGAGPHFLCFWSEKRQSESSVSGIENLSPGIGVAQN